MTKLKTTLLISDCVLCLSLLPIFSMPSIMNAFYEP